MEAVGIKEFKNKATQYLRAEKPVAIERHGKLVGFYIPVAERDEEKIKKSLTKFEKALKKALNETGLSEDAFADLISKAK
jgi:antitoxin (DNA-binding transcriptional repressor) of toxin-antitoxin stability system